MRSFSSFRRAVMAASLVAVLTAPLAAAAADSLTDERLKVDAAPHDIPFECGDAYQATRAFAVDKSPSLDTLHALIRADVMCVRSRYGGGEVGNMSLLAAAAAALLAAHRESGVAAHNDRVVALRLSRAIGGIASSTGGVSFNNEQQGNYLGPVAHEDARARTGAPSEYRNEAQQVHDAALAELRAEPPPPQAQPAPSPAAPSPAQVKPPA